MQRIINISNDIGLTDRLILALEGSAGVMRIDPAVDALRELNTSMRPDLLVVDFAADSSEFANAIAIIRAAQEIDTSWPIVAIGDDSRTDVVLAAVRAGARDFMSYTASADTLSVQIAAQLNRAARNAMHSSGNLVVITAGQPNDGEGLFAVNYAVLQAKSGGDTLLLDFHLPATVAGPALDLGLNYTIRDAVHDAARLDRTLLSTVLGRHRDSGLYVLPLALGAKESMDVTGSAILSLVASLRGMFNNVVVNLAGLQHTELLTELLNESQRFYLVTSQHFTSVKACRDLLTSLPGAEARMTLVVSEYDTAINLSDLQIRTALGLARSVQLPKARAGLINAVNKGVPFVLDQPRAPYSKAVAVLAGVAPRREKISVFRGWKPSRSFPRVMPQQATGRT